ncbi:two-component system sensor histidine kinase YesM [Anaerobacterium chartisolvens]|uniref:histidine kinase n=1 Tax=Anaerobacterium chartisolvens TaxID=1297424 RepID=A0A369BDR0_9FIRM|nr:sensor histidine kinase [Anaerobacterium chartisolvens]RCX19365.1 two-component system sensor histidine kinase YesM [Anaerobacterium chartisolvens]
MLKVRFIGSFRFKLILMLVLLILIPLIVFSLLLFGWVKDIISEKYSESAIQSVRESAINIDYRLNDLKEFTNIIMTNSDFVTILKETGSKSDNAIAYENILRNFFTSREDIEGISVYSGDSFYYVGSNKGEKTEYNTGWFKNLSGSHGEIQWINTRLEKIKIMAGDFDKYYFSIGRKLVDLNTLEELGTMVVDIDEGVLEKSYKNLEGAGAVDIFIIDSQGKIISHPQKSMIGTDARDKLAVRKVMEDGRDFGKLSYREDYKDNMVIYSTCGTTGWKLVEVIPGNYLYSEIDKIKIIVIDIGIVYLVLAFCAALFFSVKLTKPMMHMMKKMKQAEGGNLNTRIDIVRKDELGHLGISFNNMLSKIKSLMEQQIEEERIKKEIELEALHAQINPHFLYNTLNTIKWMAKMQGAKNISSTVTALIKLLRVSINLSNEMITLREEIEYVKNYVLIQKIRFNEQFEINYSIDEDCMECRIPKLILQPVVENAIIYGAREDSSSHLNIEISAGRQGSGMWLKVSDNGPGIEEEALQRIFKTEKNVNKFSVVGLNNIVARIKHYFGEKYGIEITTEPGKGTSVLLNLPYNIERREA